MGLSETKANHGVHFAASRGLFPMNVGLTPLAPQRFHTFSMGYLLHTKHGFIYSRLHHD